MSKEVRLPKPLTQVELDLLLSRTDEARKYLREIQPRTQEMSWQLLDLNLTVRLVKYMKALNALMKSQVV